jgi:hypothetical protein
MRRWTAILAIVGITAASAAGATSPTAPDLLRVATSRHHVVALAKLASDSRPELVEVARAPRMLGGAIGFQPSNVVLREQIDTLPDSTGVLRVITHGQLHGGRYYVAISSHDVGLTACRPILPRGGANCLGEWSNVRVLVVP